MLDIINSFCFTERRWASFFELTRSIFEQQPCIICIAIGQLRKAVVSDPNRPKKAKNVLVTDER